VLSTIANWKVARRVVDTAFTLWAKRRLAQLDRLDIKHTQEEILEQLVNKAQQTQFGKQHDFARIRTTEDYRGRVPLRTYETLHQEYFGSFPRMENVLWPGVPPYYALSSGTTGAGTKYLPLTQEMLDSNRKAALTMLASFLAMHPDANLFLGKMFFLGGSTDLVKLDDGILAGDLSGVANQTAQNWMRPFSYPPSEIALIADWDQKLDRFVEETSRLKITLISGVPAWLLQLFARLRAKNNAKTIAEVWPHLRCVIHGGVNFAPYRSLFEQELGRDQITLQECYPCSEGFVAFEDLRYQLLRPIPDHGIFFEFVPVDELDHGKPTRHGLWEVVPGIQYAVVVTTCAGLWSYLLGDTVCFENTDPPLLRFTGRTKYYLSAFGEHLISEEVEKAIAAAAQAQSTNIIDFHVGPVFPTSAQELGHHLYLIEAAPMVQQTTAFINRLDHELGRLNEDYRAHRQGGTGMRAPEVLWLNPGSFAAWMKSQGKLGGQHKVLRMDNTGDWTRSMAEWFRSQNLLVESPATND
jgi:hypothetical protein